MNEDLRTIKEMAQIYGVSYEVVRRIIISAVPVRTIKRTKFYDFDEIDKFYGDYLRNIEQRKKSTDLPDLTAIEDRLKAVEAQERVLHVLPPAIAQLAPDDEIITAKLLDEYRAQIHPHILDLEKYVTENMKRLDALEKFAEQAKSIIKNHILKNNS